jgi:amidophosphoribosyltransferase
MCGVMAIVGSESAAREVAAGLSLMQHRGHDGTGLVRWQNGGLQLVRGRGRVAEVLTLAEVACWSGHSALGHVRYATSGRRTLAGVQPLLNPERTIALAHNGNLVNAMELSARLGMGTLNSDSEVLLRLLQQAGARPNIDTLVSLVRELMSVVVGSYSVVLLLPDGSLLAFRDPAGLRPLVHIRRTGQRAQAFASESCAVQALGSAEVVDVPPGEIWWARADGRLQRFAGSRSQPRPCMFEWVYFAAPASSLEQASVYRVRLELGRRLAEHVRADIERGLLAPELVVPIPETAKPAAVAVAEALGLPYRELLVKQRKATRSFLLGTRSLRQQAVRLQVAPIAAELAGRRVLLVDDSIVRGTVATALVATLREAGAREVSIASAAPAIRHPCFYGIDTPVRGELVAAGRTQAEVRERLGADHLTFLPPDALVAAIRSAQPATAKPLSPCMACIDGQYPTSLEGVDAHIRTRLEVRV